MKVRGLIKDPDAYNDPPRPFFEHIVALRSCIMNAAIAWVICCIIVGVFSPTVLKWLQAPADALQAAGKIKIVSLNLTGGFSQIMSIGMWGGTALAFPAIMYFVLRFVFPALTRREKAAILFFLFAGTAFFGVGVGFAYGQLAPNVVRFFDIVNQWVGLSVTEVQIENYVPLIMKLILAFGLVFQIPLILFVLGWLGIITSDTLRHYRRFAIVIAFVLGMALTPPDPMSQLLMAVPLCLLYEVSIWGIWLKEKASFSSDSDDDKKESTSAEGTPKAEELPPPSEPAS